MDRREAGALEIAGAKVEPGTRKRTWIELGEDPLGEAFRIPVHLINGRFEGPKLAIVAAIHGDELNGIAIVHQLLMGHDLIEGNKDDPFDIEELAGSLIVVPVANVEGVRRRTRQASDGRDLNRLFPGRSKGTSSARIAHAIFESLIAPADALVDLHTAPMTRTNVSHVRTNLDDGPSTRLARSFGTQMILHSKGAKGTLRRAAAENGTPSILFEGGTSHRFEPEVVRIGVRGLLGVMASLDMIEERSSIAWPRILVRRSRWVRAENGGLIHLRVDAGSVIEAGALIATITNPFGGDQRAVYSPIDGMVIGLATAPLVHPGDPVANIVMLDDTQRNTLQAIGVEGSVETNLGTEFEVIDNDGIGLDDEN